MKPILWRAAGATAARRALLLDRDGIINRKIDGGYVLDYDRDFRFEPLFVRAVLRFCNANIPLVVVSNQSCVGRELIGGSQIEEIMQRMIADLERRGICICAYAICPHAPQSGCSCRKPAPGLIYTIAELFDLCLAECALVGDSASDVAAANAAGCRGILADPKDPSAYEAAFENAFAFMTPGIAA